MVDSWTGDNPYYLLIVRDGTPTEIDLDETGWLTTYAHLMRGHADWHLVAKRGAAIAFSMRVHEGEQPYYTGKNFSKVGGLAEYTIVRTYGIGKKCLDGSMMRLWILQNGQVCGGEDIYEFGPELVE